MQNLLESIDTPETRRKWGGMLKQAFANVESRFDSLDLGGLAMGGVSMGSKVDQCVETNPAKSATDEPDWVAIREAESRARLTERQYTAAMTPLKLELEEMSRQVVQLTRQLAESNANLERIGAEHEKEITEIRYHYEDALGKEQASKQRLFEMLGQARNDLLLQKTRNQKLMEELRARSLETCALRTETVTTLPIPPEPVTNVESEYWQDQRSSLMRTIKSLQDQLQEVNSKLRNPDTAQGKLADLEERFEVALQTVGEQQDCIFCLESDLADLRDLYQAQLSALALQC